jgi:UTP-glucose-1-phosphate uridylyltransferase
VKPTLVILAAGMGSRYGGLKQLDEVGPNGEAIIDYSLYDAIRAGFGKVVFIIRKDFDHQFKERFEPKLKGLIDFDYAYQSLDKIPEGFTLNPAREKPWGTAHAVMMAENVVKEPMAIINADDFYGREAYMAMGEFLVSSVDSFEYSMIGYDVSSTLSEYGSVSRGICIMDEKWYLTSVVERTKIQKDPDGIFFYEPEGRFPLAVNTPVSMNFWGMKPSVFGLLKEGFSQFLRDKGNELKSEYFIPLLINANVQNGRISTKVISCNSSWFGVTYREDKPVAQQQIRQLIDRKEYPANLWKKI